MPLPSNVEEHQDHFLVKSGVKINYQGKVNPFYRESTKPLDCADCPLIAQPRIKPDHKDFKKILMIGEGPAENEVLQDSMYVGDAGLYLRAMEADVPITQFGIGHTNLVKCAGIKNLEFNDTSAMWKAFDKCAPILWKEIDDLKPELVVPLGNYPLKALIPEERKGIGGCAGCLYKLDNEPFAMIPVHEPTHIIREPKNHEYYWDELNEIKLHFEKKPGPFTWSYGDGLELNEMMKHPELPIFVDFETTAYTPWDIGTVKARDKVFQLGDILCMSLCQDGLHSYVYTTNNDPLNNFIELLPKIRLALEVCGVGGHNMPFDSQYLRKYKIHAEVKEDSLLSSYALDESPRHPLKRLARKRLGMEDWSVDVSEFTWKGRKSYAFIPPEKRDPYCGMDTGAANTLNRVQLARMDENETRLYRNVLMPSVNMFIDLNFRGIRVDIGRLMEIKVKLTKEERKATKKLRDFGIKNPNSTPQIKAALLKYEVFGPDDDMTTSKTLLPFIAKDMRESGNDKGAELCDWIFAYRQPHKAVSTVLLDVARAVGSDGRVHPDAKMFPTVTGRLVYSNPSFLNFPRTARLGRLLREIFIPDKGYLWGHRDQKQFEMRVYAVINDDQVLKQLFRDGRDPHADVGAEMYGGMEAYLEENEKTGGIARVAIKATNFGTMYGRKPESIADQYDIPVSRAAAVQVVILKKFPAIPRYWKRVEDDLNRDQYLVNPLGRKRRFPILCDANYNEMLREAWNFPIQSTASDLNLLGMHTIWKSKYYKHNWLIPLFPIHDAIEYMIKESKYDEAEAWMDETLANIPASVLKVTDMQFKTDAGSGYDWAEASME